MSTGEGKAFNEVRALLGRLDRSIDEARSRRLGPSVGDAKPEPEPAARAEPTIDLDHEIGAPRAPEPKTDLQRKSASFGRARPLKRDPDSASPWRSPDDDAVIG